MTRGTDIDIENMQDCIEYVKETLAADNIRLRSRIAELEGALKPFAEALHHKYDACLDVQALAIARFNAGDYPELMKPCIGDFRRARSILSCHTAACKDSEQLSKSRTGPGIVPSK